MKTNIKEISEFPLVLSVEDVAKIMNISRVTAYELAHSEGFPCKLIGKRIIIPRDTFYCWLKGINIDSSAFNGQELAVASANA